MNLMRRFICFIVSVYTHKPTEDDPVTDSTDTTVVQSGAAYAAASEADAQATITQSAGEQTASSASVLVSPGEVLQTAENAGAELEAKAKSIFAFLVREGHKAEDLFVDARDSIFALAAKLV